MYLNVFLIILLEARSAQRLGTTVILILDIGICKQFRYGSDGGIKTTPKISKLGTLRFSSPLIKIDH